MTFGVKDIKPTAAMLEGHDCEEPLAHWAKGTFGLKDVPGVKGMHYRSDAPMFGASPDMWVAADSPVVGLGAGVNSAGEVKTVTTGVHYHLSKKKKVAMHGKSPLAPIGLKRDYYLQALLTMYVTKTDKLLHIQGRVISRGKELGPPSVQTDAALKSCPEETIHRVVVKRRLLGTDKFVMVPYVFGIIAQTIEFDAAYFEKERVKAMAFFQRMCNLAAVRSGPVDGEVKYYKQLEALSADKTKSATKEAKAEERRQALLKEHLDGGLQEALYKAWLEEGELLDGEAPAGEASVGRALDAVDGEDEVESDNAGNGGAVGAGSGDSRVLVTDVPAQLRAPSIVQSRSKMSFGHIRPDLAQYDGPMWDAPVEALAAWLLYHGAVRVSRHNVTFSKPHLLARIDNILRLHPDGLIPHVEVDGVFAMEQSEVKVDFPPVRHTGWCKCSDEALAGMPHLTDECLRKIIRRSFSDGEVRKAATEFRTDVQLAGSTVCVADGCGFLQVLVRPRMVQDTYVVHMALQQQCDDVSQTLVTRSCKCTCPAGLTGACHHVLACLFAIAAVQRGTVALESLASPGGEEKRVWRFHEVVDNMFDTVFIRPTPENAGLLWQFRRLHAALTCAHGTLLSVQVAGRNGYKGISMEKRLKEAGLWSATAAAAGLCEADIKCDAMIKKSLGPEAL